MTRTEKKMIGAIIVMAAGFYVMIDLAAKLGKSAYTEHKTTTDSHKKKCLDKYKTIDYEIVSGKLYCKTNEGLVEFH